MASSSARAPSARGQEQALGLAPRTRRRSRIAPPPGPRPARPVRSRPAPLPDPGRRSAARRPRRLATAVPAPEWSRRPRFQPDSAAPWRGARPPPSPRSAAPAGDPRRPSVPAGCWRGGSALGRGRASSRMRRSQRHLRNSRRRPSRSPRFPGFRRSPLRSPLQRHARRRRARIDPEACSALSAPLPTASLTLVHAPSARSARGACPSTPAIAAGTTRAPPRSWRWPFRRATNSEHCRQWERWAFAWRVPSSSATPATYAFRTPARSSHHSPRSNARTRSLSSSTPRVTSLR